MPTPSFPAPLARPRFSLAGKRNQAWPGRRRGEAARGPGPARGAEPPPFPRPRRPALPPAPSSSSRPAHLSGHIDRTMKALLLAVLAAVLCVERAHTLVCFSCSDASSNWACLTPVKCGENENHCVTTYVGVGLGGKSGQSISKGCSPICPSAGINLGIAAASVYCCDSFLCNISGSSSVRASYAILALGILISFIYVLQARQ
ncbi:Lymphocyte antigen 6E [Lonchura striata]|uniref:Lymphocyte antigen 6E n=2 Tax=Lonchura striata TaxID=40157 RepID=A0A218UGJ7_9PASE|nr:Lymphocyte antigen 6E [Lonchura striata domestica]